MKNTKELINIKSSDVINDINKISNDKIITKLDKFIKDNHVGFFEEIIMIERLIERNNKRRNKDMTILSFKKI